eukprot:g6838.t1
MSNGEGGGSTKVYVYQPEEEVEESDGTTTTLRNRKKYISGKQNKVLKFISLKSTNVLPEKQLTEEEIKTLKNVQRVNGFLAGISVFPCATSKRDVKVLREFGPRNVFVRALVTYLPYICFIVHICTDIFESYMYRGLATAVTFLVAFFQMTSIILLGKKNVSAFYQDIKMILEKTSANELEHTYIFGQVNTSNMGGLPKSFIQAFIGLIFQSILWFGLLAWEGIVQMELESFGVGFVITHLFCTALQFLLPVADMVYVTYSFDKLKVHTKAFDDDIIYIRKCVLDNSFEETFGGGNGMGIEVSIMRAWIAIKDEIKSVEKKTGLIQAISIMGIFLTYVTVTVSIVTQDYSKKGFVPIYGMFILGGPMMSFLFAGIPSYERRLRRLSKNVKEISHLGAWNKLIAFLRDEDDLSYKLLGIALDWQLVGRLVILVLSIAATSLQYFLNRGGF